MKTLTKKQAIKRFNTGKSVLIVYPYNTHATVNSATVFDNKGLKFAYEPDKEVLINWLKNSF